MKLVHWLVPLLIALVTVIAFFPSLENGFVNWDDNRNLLDNPDYRGLGREQLRWMFTTFHMSLYRPLTWVTLGLDYLLWGMDPFGYHLTSLLFHTLNAMLFYFLAYRLLALTQLSSDVAGDLSLRVAAGFAALLFSIHPLRVEAVAWISARNDVVSGLFFLWTILCYLRYATMPQGQHGRSWWMVASVILYGLSLLSKGGGMILPMVLVVLDIYPLSRLGGSRGNWFGPAARRVWREKLPFLMLAFGAGVIGLLAKYEAGAMRPFDEYGLLPRVAQVLFGLAFYLWKTLVPVGLSPLYELATHMIPWYWPFHPSGMTVLVLSGLSVLVLSVAFFTVRQRWPAGLSIWVCYLAILAPVLGITESGPQIAADRYSYLSCLGWSLLAGGGALYLCKLSLNHQISRQAFLLATGGAVVSVITLGLLTWRQVQVWHDSERLWRHALTVAHESSIARNNLGTFLFETGRLKEAIEEFEQAVQLDPQYEMARYNLRLALVGVGKAQAESGELQQAMVYFHRALEISHEDAETHSNLGKVLAEMGKLDEAVKHYRSALRINPNDADTYNNLGIAQARVGNLKEAVRSFRDALDINPKDPDTYNNLGIALAREGDLKGAIKHFRRALEVSPKDAGAARIHFNLSAALAKEGNLDEAVSHLREVVRIQPDFAQGHESLGQALALQGKREEAIKHYQEALRIWKAHREADAQR